MEGLDLASEFDKLAATYDAVAAYVRHVGSGKMRSLIVAGPPGVGKSFMVRQYLEACCPGTHKIVMGQMTPFALYHALHAHRQPGQVVVLDDVDSVFNKVEGLNLLKAVMDTQPKRVVTWAAGGAMLTSLSLPSSFEFKGGVILITNVGFGDAGRSKLATHLKALLDRSYSVRVCDGSRQSAFHHVAFMVLEKGLFGAYSLDDAEVTLLLTFLYENLERLNTVSLRAAIKLAELYLLEPTTWRRTAGVALMGAAQ